MTLFADNAALALFELDQTVLGAEDFDALSNALVHWVLQAGVDGAYVGRPDGHGWIRPGALAGQGMQAYVERTRVSILDTCAEGRGVAGRAWRTRQVQVEALTHAAAGSSEPPAASGTAGWRAAAAVPLVNGQQCVGLLCLFSRDADELTGQRWTTTLSHLRLITGVALDRLRLSAEQGKLRELSLRDPLTGLPNMTALAHHLEQAVPRALRANVPLVIGLLDLDKFKPVNDLFGHDAGDSILRTIAARLRAEMRASDFVARRSGDEFVIVLEDVRKPRRALVSLLERLHERLTQPIEIGNTSWRCGVSLGLALYPVEPLRSPDDALAEADRALRASKLRRNDRGQWWCWASLADTPAGHEATGTSDPDPYSPQGVPELASLSAQLERSAAAIVNDFYERLERQPKSRRILAAMSGAEREHLKSQQIRNLFSLADPCLTEADHRKSALRVGRIHAAVGLDREEMVRSRGTLGAAVYSHLGKSISRDALQVFTRRLNRDLVFQSEAYQHLHGERQDALRNIARHAWSSESYADLITRIVEVLGACDEIGGVAISRPDRQGVFRVEAAAGRILEGHPVERAPAPAGAQPYPGLLETAWRGGKIERSVNIGTDPRMASWRPIAEREGLRSSVAIPLCPFGQAPFAILTLHSQFPGGYTSADQCAFIDLLQTLLAFAMGRVAGQEGSTRPIPYTTRRKWNALLRSDALQMHCQPIVDLKTGRVTKVEMLARLNEGTRLLTPYEFFPALKSEDFFDLYVLGLKQTLEHRSTWLLAGTEIGVSLNLPSSALLDRRYFEATRQALELHGCPPHMLTLELLESEALPGDAGVAAELARFKSLGVMLAEDDLGAGHSSLLRLRELPFDWIKIDRSIVSLAGQNVSNVLSFIYQLTRLGHSIGKSVIVEGVESEALLEACSILGVDAVQGYAIARPMPADQLVEWLAARAATAAVVDESDAPLSAVGKLATLLMWEERLHLIGDSGNAAECAGEISAPDESSMTPDGRSLRQMMCEGCRLPALLAGSEPVLLEAAAAKTAVQALLDALATHGPRSAAYSVARQHLVSVFNAGPPAA